MKTKVLLTAFLLLSSLSNWAQLPSYLPANGLVAWYPFNGNANDESGNGNNASTVQAPLTTDRLNQIGKAYSFNGASEFIEIQHSSSFEFNNSISISAWINVSELFQSGGAGFFPIISKSNQQFVYGTFAFGIWSPNLLAHFKAQETGAPFQINFNEWQHVIVIISNGETKFYSNGNLIFNGPSGIFPNQYNSNLPIRIGNDRPGLVEYANGKIDDVGIWNRALTPQEVASIYSGQAPCQNTSGSIAASISIGETYSFNGQNLTTAGTYTATLQNAAGCDSVVTLNLSVEPAVEPLNCEISSSDSQLCLGENSILSIDSINVLELLNLEVFLANNPELQFITSIGQSNYFVLNTPLNWNDAKAYGDSRGLSLFVINNASEESLVYNSLPFKGNDFISYWIGLYQDPTDVDFSEPAGGWKWVDGSSLNYQNWFPSEPNNNVCCPAEENCGLIEFASYGKPWNDLFCGLQNLAIFETRSTAILWSTGETTPSISVSPTETTTYSVTVTQGDQTCTSEFTITVNQPSAIAETASVCNSYTWNGNTYTQSGTYTWTGTNAAGCDSVVTLNLTITPQPEQPQLACWQTATFDASSCSWVISGTQPVEPTNLACYETAVFNSTICEWEITGTQPPNLYLGGSSVPLPPVPCNASFFFNDVTCAWDVIVTPVPTIVTNASACVSYTWEANGATYNSSGQYSFNSNCQEYTLNLTINQSSTSSVNASITEGENYSFNGQNLTTAGTYTATLQNAAGCDSLVTLNLTVEAAVEPLNCEITASEANVCAGETVALNINGIANSTGLAICSVEALPENLQQGLVGFYPFCGNANDVSINANNGEVNGAIFSTNRFDNPGSSLELDGNDYVTIQPVSALNGLTNYTISAWVKQNNMPIGRGVIFSNWVNNTIPTGSPISNILWANQNRVQLALRAGQESTTLPISDFNNNWINITAVYDGSNPNALSRLKFYINGIETSIDCGFVASNCNHPSSLGTIANEGYIGARRVANSIVEYFNGKIDDLFLFNRSISMEEIEQIANLGESGASILWSTGETTPSISVSPTETTTYSVTVTQGGQTCSSEVTITVNQPSAETVNATITEGETYNFNGQSLTVAGTYTATLQNVAGCDSVVTLNLTVNPAPVAGCNAFSVINFTQGQRADATNVTTIRSNPELALGMPEPVVTNVVNFVSLGFGGSITLAFETPIANGAGNDIRIDEATWNNNPCNRYPERADVFASQDGVNFVYLGLACQDASFDLGALSWAQYVRIVDVSDLLSFNADADGFDVNGIECLNGAATSLNNDGLVACSLQEIVSYTPGNRKNGTAVGAPRNNPANALGTPQNNNTINFTALGFGGTMVAKFDYVVFNQPGNDLRVTETSFGNPSCNNYPEKARVSVSLDGNTWTELGEICQDGELDLGTLPYAQYIRIQDASPMSSNKFNGSADGFDVDAVVVLNNGCGTSSARLAQMDNTTTPDASLVISAFPNPMEDYTIVNFEGLENDSDFNLQILDAAGRIIRNNNIRVSTANPSYLFDASELARGIYQVIIANENGSHIIRLVK